MSEFSSEEERSPLPPLDLLLTLADAAERSGLSASHLRLLVRTEQVWGIKLGRHWFTTADAVNQYLSEGHKPGPKPTATP